MHASMTCYTEFVKKLVCLLYNASQMSVEANILHSRGSKRHPMIGRLRVIAIVLIAVIFIAWTYMC